jgi:hypothetical protein
MKDEEIELNNQEKILDKKSEKEEEEKKIKDLFIEYSKIVDEEKIKNFIYKCLIIDFLAIFIYSYKVLHNFMDIDGQIKGFLYLFKYISSFINGVLYIYYIILCMENKDKVRKDRKINGEKRNPPVYEYLKSYYNKGIDKDKDKELCYNLDGKVILNNKEKIIGLLYKFKLWTWFLKYISFIIYMILETQWNLLSYTSLFILIIDYYQYYLNKLYYFVILRKENILQNILTYEKQI